MYQLYSKKKREGKNKQKKTIVLGGQKLHLTYIIKERTFVHVLRINPLKQIKQYF